MSEQLMEGDIENALHAAKHGQATGTDWDLIYWACGLRQQYQAESTFNFLSAGDNNDIDGQRRR